MIFIYSCLLYTSQGEFLPELAGEEWVAVSGMEYQKLYFDCLREAEALLKSRGDVYKRQEILCGIAANSHGDAAFGSLRQAGGRAG